MFSLDKNSTNPLYRQLSDAIEGQINAGELLPDTKLPTIRALADALEVNNTTIIAAYKHLEQKRIVYSIRGSGTYAAKPVAASTSAIPEMSVPSNINEYINFADMTPDPAYFPTTAIRNAFDTVLTRDGAKAFDYPGWKGYEPLREVLCKDNTQDIHIISNLRQGIEIASDGLLNPGDTVLMERPSTQDTAAIFTSRGARIIEMPIKSGEPDLENLEVLLKKHRPKLFFLMPTYQIPTGICYTKQAKTKILEFAHNTGAYIIESDSYSDLYYAAKPQPLKADDNHGHVIYIKSFDRVLAPGLLNFMTYPKEISSRFCDGSQPPGYIQRGLEFYLQSGGFFEHMAFLRSQYARRYRKGLAAVETYLSPVASYIIPSGGLSFWVTPNKQFDYTKEFFGRKVLVAPGKLFMSGNAPHFRISFANVSEERISEGVGIIASVLRSAEYG